MAAFYTKNIKNARKKVKHLEGHRILKNQLKLFFRLKKINVLAMPKRGPFLKNSFIFKVWTLQK